MKPAHRSHAGWCDEVRHHPQIPRRVKRVLLEIADGTYVTKATNVYAITHAELAARLLVDRSNVKRATWWAIDNGWLVVCQQGRKGSQQTYHRSVPWDPPRKWRTRPCPYCGGYLTVRQSVQRRAVEVDGVMVDVETGEVIEPDGSGVRIAPLFRTPDRTPYKGTRWALGSRSPVPCSGSRDDYAQAS